jgi:cytochrome c556
MRSTILLLFAAAAIAQAPSFKPKPVGNLKQVMRSIALPNSDIIFAVQSKAPADEKGWQTVENAAIAISETTTLITMPGRVRSNGQPVPVQRADWIKYAQALVPAGQACYKAAQSKNQDAVSNCTDQLSEACDNCHKVYRDNQK